MIKVYDKDDNFKRTIPWKEIGGDVQFSNGLNSGMWPMSLRINWREETYSSWSWSSNLWITHWDIIRVIDPMQNTVVESTYERLLDNTYDWTVVWWLTIVDDVLEFDNTSSLITTTYIIPSEYSVFGRIRIDSYSWSNEIVYDQANASTWADRMAIVHNQSTGVLQVFSWWTNVINVSSFSSKVAEWEYFDFVLRSKSWNNQFYLNWTLDSSNTITWSYVSRPFVIGRNFNSAQYFDWWIDHIWFYDKYITDSEVESIINGNIPVDSLALYYSWLKYAWTAWTPTSITNALPDNTKQVVTDYTIYSWFVYEVSRKIFPTEEYHIVEALGIQTILNTKIYTYSAATSFTRTVDASTIITEILDEFSTYFSYTGSTIPTYWTTVSIEFDNVTCREALQKVIDTTWRYLRFDPDWVVYFFEIQASPTKDFDLSLGNTISRIDYTEESDKLYNDVTVEYTWWSTVNATDATSISTYWTREKYITNGDLKDSTTATEYANAYLSFYKDPVQKIQVMVSRKYDIESIRPWMVVDILWDPLWIWKQYIQKVDFSPDECKIRLTDYDSLWKSLQVLQ